MSRRSGSPSQTWGTLWNHHVPHLIESIPSTDLIPNLQAGFERVVHALHRGLNQMLTSWIRRFLGNPTLVSTLPNDLTLVSRVWTQQVMDRVQTSERSPPAPTASSQRDEVAKN